MTLGLEVLKNFSYKEKSLQIQISVFRKQPNPNLPPAEGGGGFVAQIDVKVKKITLGLNLCPFLVVL